MQIDRVVIKNFRCFDLLDVVLKELVTCVIGENNTGKSNFLHAIRLCIDTNLSSSYRSLIRDDIHSTADISHPTQIFVGLEIGDFQSKLNDRDRREGHDGSASGLSRRTGCESRLTGNIQIVTTSA